MSEKRRPLHPLAAEAVWERRRLLRAGGILAAVAGTGGVGALLAACSSDDASQRAATTTTSVPPVPTTLPGDPDEPWFRRGNFAPVFDEVDAFDLEVEGALPPELTGLFVRNGSNAAGEPSPHWFLGDGMLHGVRLEEGRAVSYRNRWVRTPLMEAGVGLTGDGPPGGERSQSNVSVVHHGGKLLSLGEIGFPYEVDVADLSTVGPFDYGGALTTSATAHPKIDPDTGHLHFFGYGFVPPYLTYHEADADGTLLRSTVIPTEASAMIHDFAVTDQEAIFWELPVLFDLDVAIAGGGMPFSWQPDYGGRIGILPFGAEGEDIRWVEIDPCYVFHGINAHRNGDDVVLDVCRMDSMFDDSSAPNASALHRWTVDTSGEQLSFTDERLDENDLDLPTVDRRFTGRPTRHAWMATFDRDPEIEFTGVAGWDSRTGEIDRWRPAPALRPGEPVLAPAGPGEGEGWLLTFAHDEATGNGVLVVLDALDVAAGPVATVHLPARVPYGFHGWWVPDDPSATA
ncbi:MAG: carotenoid oxygenase family protein [Acidimicrobiia bacterium]|nr:carotenoid oxygenase family protein [Acidimicrobiia bacterium]